MKLLVICLFAGVLAEPPRFRPARFRFQRQELAPTTTDAPMESTTEMESMNSGPYPPSGWKPAGEPFTLPTENKDPADTYGPPSGPYPPLGWKPDGEPFNLPQEQPQGTYGTPEKKYGSPTEATTLTGETTESTESPQSEKVEGPVEVQKSVGTYYVLLPNGQLQRVEFLTENDVQNMRYTERLELRDRAPLLVFGP